MTVFVSLLLRMAGLLCLGSVAGSVFAQGAGDTPGSLPALLRQMPGTWDVEARMWPGPNAKAVQLPPATAHRALIRDVFLQETMEARQGADGPPFTRVAYFSYNSINRQYEYFSLDSRLPQMMSYAIPGANEALDGKVELAGTSFVAPEWGAEKNVPFMYRFVIGPVEGNEQVMQLYLTRQGGAGREFLAFEYVYSRRD